MSASGQIDYEWEGDNEEPHVATVTYFYTAARPGRRHGHPDDWSPPDPSEIEVTEVEIDGRVLNREEETRFLDRHWDSLVDAIEEHEAHEGRLDD